MRLESGGTTLYPVCSVIDFDGEAEDHARLIAAAPEMLEALRECFSDPNCFAFASDDFYKAKQRLLAINKIVRDAVMNATGETIK